MERRVEGEKGQHDSAFAEEDRGACDDDVPHASEVAVARPVLSEALAEHVQSSRFLLAAYKQAMDVLRECGAMPAVQTLENEVKHI